MVASSFDQNEEELQDEDLLAVYGKPESSADDLSDLLDNKRCDFKPWHHPVKQVVRHYQWAALTKKLIEDRPRGASQILKYFTLPGADLLDVRVLAEICEPLGVKIEYFGFDARTVTADEIAAQETTSRAHGMATTAESALLQAGRITSDAVILGDRLEDIALAESQAAIQLSQRTAFDVINIDACDHLAYCPKGRASNTFNALQTLLAHQMSARSPWLLFVTTRAEPELLGQPGIVFQNAVTQNLNVANSGFGGALAKCLDADIEKLGTELPKVWGARDMRFLRLYTIGLGKFLLQFFHGQPNLPAKVELASSYAYSVYGDQPDMLAVAFRITPDGPRVFAPSVGGAAIVPDLEPMRATYIASQATKLQNLDEALETEEAVKHNAVEGTKALLESARYDIAEWCKWLAGHERRPMTVSQT